MLTGCISSWYLNLQWLILQTWDVDGVDVAIIPLLLFWKITEPNYRKAGTQKAAYSPQLPLRVAVALW